MRRSTKSVNPLSRITACILAGGLGTRLRSVVSDRSKVMACVHGRPFVTFLLDQLHDAGFTKAVLCTGYLGRELQQELGKTYRGMKLAYSQEKSPLGTAGALRLALPKIDSETVLAMNGDSYCSADLAQLHARHDALKFESTLTLTEVTDCARFGHVETTAGGRVKRFEEKGSHVGPGWINAGIYLFDRQLLDEVPAGQPVSLERDVLPQWIDRGVGAYRAPSRFLDIGTPESYAETERFFAPPAKKSA